MSDALARDQQPEAWSGAAAGYEDAFAPFTRLYVDELLDRLGVGPGTSLLDVAAGTGAVTLAACERGADVLATDFAPGMVEHLAHRLAERGHSTARTAVMDGQALDVDDDAMDVAVSLFGVIFFPDIDAGLRELRRVVRPGGLVGVGTWNVEGFRLVELVSEAVATVLPDLEQPSAAPTWARVGTAEGLQTRLEAAGLIDVTAHLAPRTWAFTDPTEFFRKLPTWSPPVQPLFDVLPAEQIDAAAVAFAEVVARHEADGELTFEALLGIGTAPG